MPPVTEYHSAKTTVVNRLLLVVALIVLMFVLMPPSPQRGYRIGSGAIVYNGEADQFIDKKEYVEVLDYSLEAGRGILGRQVPAGVSLLISDAWEAVYEFEIHNDGRVKKWVHPQAEVVCPQGECESLEHGGFVTNAIGAQLLCETHAKRLFARNLVSAKWKESDVYESPPAYQQHLPGHPLDAVAVKDGVVVVGLSAQANGPRGGDLLPGKLVMYGSELTELPVKVTHPVGLTFSRDKSRLYVADMNAGQLTWRQFEYDQTTFRESRVLWSVAVPQSVSFPPLFQMVVGSNGSAANAPEAVFAAAPDGLYVFRGDGGLLSKYHLDAAVSGLTWGRDGELFMTVGRRVARLRTKALTRDVPFVLPCSPPEKGGTVLNTCGTAGR